MFKFFIHSYRFFLKHPLVFRIGLLVLLGILAFTASRITFNEDISRLIPTTSKNETLQKILKQVRFSDKIIVHISKNKKGTTTDLTSLAAHFIDSLKPYQDLYVHDIQGQVSDETALETLDFVYDHLPVFLAEEDYPSISQKLSKDSIQATVNRNYNILVSPSGLVAKKTIVRDPLGISVLGLQKLKKLGVQEGFVLRDGFLMSEDATHILLFITPKFKPADTQQNEAFAKVLYGLQKHLNQEFAGIATLELFGGSLIAVANAQQIKRDIQITVGISITLLVLLLIVFYKQITVPVLLLLPTLIGALVGISFLYLLRGEISAISLGIGSILLGVTLDYSLHLLTHIKNHGNTEQLFTSITKPIIMSSATTALAFLCLLFLDAPALQDLGIFAAVSVLGASVAALFVIPQLYHTNGTAQRTTTILDRFATYPFHSNNLLVGLVCIVGIVSVGTFHKVDFNEDLSSLNYVSPPLKNAETRLDSLIHVSSKSLYLITHANNLQTALEQNEQLSQQLFTLQKQGAILRYNTVAPVAVSNKKQTQLIHRWKQFWSSSKKDTLLVNLIASGEQVGMKPKAFQEFNALLQKDFTTVSLSNFKSLNALPVHEFISETENLATVTTLVKINEDKRAVVEAAFTSEENTFLIDRQAVNESLLGTLKNDFNTLILYCSIAIAFLLLLFYRNLKRTLVTLLPILVTWWITLGIMGMFGLEFNVLNIIVSSFVFGLGVDFCIFMTNALLEGKSNTLATYKTAILLSALTTLLGMGALIFAKHPALHSISIISMVGISSALLISFILQPILYRLLIFKGQMKKEAS